MGSFVWHVREGSLDGPELASAYRYHPFSVDEPHIGTDDVFLEGGGPWRVIDFQRTDMRHRLTAPSARRPALNGHDVIHARGGQSSGYRHTVDGELRQDPDRPDGGESACFAHLLCPDCGVVLDGGPHAEGCSCKPGPTTSYDMNSRGEVE